MAASVKVAVRVRPFNERELKMNCFCVIDVEGEKTTLSSKSEKGKGSQAESKEFTFDYSYWSHNTESPHFASQEKVYNDLGSSVVSNSLQGYNNCVFAYGQTGSGKTYTMMGSQGNLGLIPRICENLFSSMEKGRESGTTYKVEVSYLEIYNERVKDLLSCTRQGTNFESLKVREHSKHGPYVEGLSRHVVTQYPEVSDLIESGNSFRTTAATNMNDTSSRSHAIFTLTFIQAKLQADIPLETRSKINLVDLAGSERAVATGAVGKRLKEGSHINKSLVTLGIVISALAEQGSKTNKKPHIPYRDSILTFLLKDSLGGNSKTIMIATISPADVNHGETLSTLRYANRAKNIVNKPTVNEDANVKLIKELREEIAILRRELDEQMKNAENGTKVEEGSIRATLNLKEAQEKELTDKWNEKWRKMQCILREQRTLELRKAGESGRGVVLDSERPHLTLYDDDLGSSGLTLYHLNEVTTIGASQHQDIQLQGQGMKEEHCIIILQGEEATLQRKTEAELYVNDQAVKDSTKLLHGDVILIGVRHMFRYNDPQEAARIRKQGNRSSMNLSRLSFTSRSTTDLVRSYDSLPGVNDTNGVRGLGERRATDDSIIHKRNETTDCCEISTQTSNQNTQSHPSTPVISDCSLTSNIKKKSSLTLPLEGENEKSEGSDSPSIDSTPASDTFYTATSILTPDVADLLSPTSPDSSSPPAKKKDQSPSPQKDAETGEQPSLNVVNDIPVFIASPIKLVDGFPDLLNFSSAVGGAVTSTPKRRVDEPPSIEESCRPKEIRKNLTLEAERDEQQEQTTPNADCAESSEGLSACRLLPDYNISERSELIHFDDNVTKVNDVIDKLHGKDEKENDKSREEQQKELRDLHSHYTALENNLLGELNGEKGDEKDEGNDEREEMKKEEEAKDAAGRRTRPHQLALESVLKEERVVMLIEKEVQRRLMEEVSNLEKKCRLHELEEGCQCKNRMVSSSSPNSLKSIPRTLSPAELRPYSSLSAECAYDYGAARGVMYESRSSSDDLLLSPVPLNSPLDGEYDMTCGICVTLPTFEFKGSGSSGHWEYQVRISVGRETWMVYRRYRRFRELHLFMCHKYGPVIQDLYFPPRRIFGNNSLSVIERRRKELEIYLQQLITLCTDMEGSPLCDVIPSRQLLEKFSPFFHKGLNFASRRFTMS